MIYLDHSATSLPKAQGVAEAMVRALQWGNPGRSGYEPALESSRAMLATRCELASLLGMRDESRLVFTSGATEALNLGIRGILKSGARVISTNLEHNSVARPLANGQKNDAWQWIILDACGADFCYELDAALKIPTELVVVNHVSNVSGQRQSMELIRKICREVHTPLLWDVSQSVGCELLELQAGEMLAGGAHKGLRGPMGLGFLAVGDSINLRPMMFGGTGSASESLDLPSFWPDRYESGTPNVPGMAGLGAALRGLSTDVLRQRERDLQLRRNIIWDGLQGVLGLQVIGPRSGGTAISVQMQLDSGVLAQNLWEKYKIALRVGLHCSPLAHQSLGTFPQGTLRIAPSHDTKMEDLRTFLEVFLKEFPQHS